MSIQDNELNRLNNLLTKLESWTLTYHQQIFRKSELQSLQSISEQLQLEREAYNQTTQRNIEEAINPLVSKIKQFKETKFINVKDFKTFETEMLEIQNKLDTLKNCTKSELSKLELIENNTSLEIDYYNNKIEEWEQPIKVYVSNTEATKPKPNNYKHLCKEVVQFQNFILESGGFENGWRKDDHQTFLKLRAKHKNIDSLANAVHEIFPDITKEATKAHEAWYRKYLELENKKKEALKKWQSQSKAHLSRPVTVPECKSKLKQRPQQSREEIQKALENWKKYKDTKEKQMKFELEEKKQQRIMAEEIKKKYDEELKTKVAKWREQELYLKEKKMLMLKTMEEEERRKRALEANKLIKQFQSQDNLLISKIKERKKSKQDIPQRSRSKTIVERDPRRLLKPTKQWIHRVHDESNYEIDGVRSVYILPKLGIPEWRKDAK